MEKISNFVLKISISDLFTKDCIKNLLEKLPSEFTSDMLQFFQYCRPLLGNSNLSNVQKLPELSKSLRIEISICLHNEVTESPSTFGLLFVSNIATPNLLTCSQHRWV